MRKASSLEQLMGKTESTCSQSEFSENHGLDLWDGNFRSSPLSSSE